MLLEIYCATKINRHISKQLILGSISSKDLAKSLVRVKSSNLWARTINIKDTDSSTGDMLIQFKNESGGPGDVYIYYDVPIRIWQRFLSANSAGHFFWLYIRNNFRYKKLTGDKHGKLNNAVN